MINVFLDMLQHVLLTVKQVVEKHILWLAQEVLKSYVLSLHVNKYFSNYFNL